MAYGLHCNHQKSPDSCGDNAMKIPLNIPKSFHVSSKWQRINILPCLACTAIFLASVASAEEEIISETNPVAPSFSAPESAGKVDLAKPGLAPGRGVIAGGLIRADGAPLEVGSFLVSPQLDVTRAHDSNVYLTNSAQISDQFWTFSPAVWAKSNWVEHALNLHAATDSVRYKTVTAEDSDDFRVSAEGRYDISRDRNVFGGARYLADHEDRESPTAQNGLTPTKYQQHQYYAGFFSQLDKVSVRLAGTVQRLNYADVDFLAGGGLISVINNDDRDRMQYTGGVRLGYEMSPRTEPYVEVAIDNRRYENELDDLGYQRNSDGQRYFGGVRWNIPREFRIDVFAGWIRQDYVDPRFGDVAAPIAGTSLEWMATDRTTVAFHLDRSVEETTVSATPAPGVVVAASSFLNTFSSVGVEHRFTDQFSARLSASLSRAEYQQIGRQDDYYGMSIGVAYRVHRNLIVDLSATRRELRSSVPLEDFKKELVFVRASIPFSH